MTTNEKTSITYIKDLLLTNDVAVGRAMVALYKRQTEGEQRTSTTVESNGKGFSAFHAKNGTYYAKWVKSGRVLTGKHLVAARKMALHYVRQLSSIAAEKATAHIAADRKVLPQKPDTIPCPPPVDPCEVTLTTAAKQIRLPFTDLQSAITLTDPFQLR
jgi:hypothetical protein